VIDFFSVTKSIALFIVIITGFIWLGGEGGTENLRGMFENSSDSPGNYALAFYSVNFKQMLFFTTNFMNKYFFRPIGLSRDMQL
jgi:hypothetical protein